MYIELRLRDNVSEAAILIMYGSHHFMVVSHYQFETTADTQTKLPSKAVAVTLSNSLHSSV